MEPTVPRDTWASQWSRLDQEFDRFAAHYPATEGVPGRRPVHVVYGGAHLFRADTAPRLGALARRAFADYAPDPAALAEALGWDGPGASTGPDLARVVHARVEAKLATEAVEDYRIDFEDGYGVRADDEEDAHAVAAAEAVAEGLAASTLPPFLGIRVKPFSGESRERAVRTLDLFLTTLLHAGGGRLPANFVVTLPKVTIPAQGAVLAAVLEKLEPALGLPPAAIPVEVLIETPQILVDHAGRSAIPALRAALGPRLRSAHLGAFDLTAALEISAVHQSLDHPACDFARLAMQIALAGTGVWVADSVTTELPIPPHRAPAEGPPLDTAALAENRAVVHAAWRRHARNVEHALARGIYQGWDLHPAQLPARYAALYRLFLAERDALGARLRNFLEARARATRVGHVFDDAASARGLVNHVLRAVDCGAFSADEVVALTGVSRDELRRVFA